MGGQECRPHTRRPTRAAKGTSARRCCPQFPACNFSLRDGIVDGMRSTSLILFLSLLAGFAQAETCTLQTYAASWMQSGTPFTVQCSSGKYDGVLITKPARRYFRRGSLVLKFNQPVVAVAPKNDEGVFHPGRGKQISSMLLSGGAGIGVKDMTDGLSGAIFKSYYMIPVTFAAIAVFENGGDVLLKPGFKLNTEANRLESGPAAH